MDHDMPLTYDHEALCDLVGTGLLTVKEIAYATGYATTYIYEFLNARRNPTCQMFNRILVYAASLIPSDRERFVRIFAVIMPRLIRGTPVQAHVTFGDDGCDRPIEDIRRDVGVLCREIGDVADHHSAVWADGQVDRRDAPDVAELNAKVPLLMQNLSAMLAHVNRKFDASGAGRAP